MKNLFSHSSDEPLLQLMVNDKPDYISGICEADLVVQVFTF